MALNWRLGTAVAVHSCLATSPFYVFTVLASLEPLVKNLTINSLSSHYNHSLTEDQWPWTWAMINSSLHFGCLIGSPLLKITTDTFGRRNSLMLVRNIALMLATLMQFAALPLNAIELLVAGRFLVGVSECLTLFVPVFVGECAPISLRGAASMCLGIGFRTFNLLGPICALSQVLGTQYYWNLALFLPFLPSFIHLLCTPFFPKSPKYLFMVENNEQESRKSIEFYHGKDANIEQLFAEYSKEARLSLSAKSTSLREILGTRHLRWPFLLCLAVHAVIPLTGGSLVNSYSTGVIGSFGISRTQAAVFTLFALQLPAFLASFVAAILVERCGRRPLMLFGLGIMLMGMFLLFISDLIRPLSLKFSTGLSIVGMCLILVGCGPMMLRVVLITELCPQAIRSYTATVSNTTFWFLVLITVFAFPPLNAAIGTFALLPMTLFSSIVWVFLWLYLPETKGKTVHATVCRWKDP